MRDMRLASDHRQAKGWTKVLLLCVLSTLALPVAASPWPIPQLKAPMLLKVQVEPTTLSRIGGTRFDELIWRGGLVVQAAHRAFGGFSGLVVSADGTRALAVSDRGLWWQMRLTHDEKGQLSGLEERTMLAPLLSSKGRPLSGWWRDAEAVAPFDARRLDGPLLVAFERRARLALYDWGKEGPKAQARYLFLPVPIRRARENGEIESIARFWNGPLAGHILGVIEKGRAKNGARRAFLWQERKVIPFFIESQGAFRITDTAVLPDGSGFLTLERRITKSFTEPPAFSIRLFRSDSVRQGALLRGKVLMQATWPLQAIDNMEGLALYERGGELRLVLISDDNFNRGLQSTLLFEFALPKNRLRALLTALRGDGQQTAPTPCVQNVRRRDSRNRCSAGGSTLP